jgi:anti-sigma regulatory factor (Ser/Thr protein kinase)
LQASKPLDGQLLAEPLLASELLLRAVASELGVARRYVRAGADAFGLDAEHGYDLVYAANEAVTNAIRHGAPNRDGRIVLSINATNERLMFSVRDFGTFTMPTGRPLDAASEGGRGFALMARLVDDVRLHADAHGTTVVLCKVHV